MKILLNRTYSNGAIIDGQLLIDQLRVCDTTENHDQALPAGTYPMVIMKSRRYARKMVYVVTPQAKPMLNMGNGAYHRPNGDILLGTYQVNGCVTKSREAFNTVFDRIRKSVERGHPIELTIKDEYLR